MKLEHANYYSALEQIVQDTRDLLQRADPAGHEERVERLAEAGARLREEAPLRIALVGEFSAGKSALVAALTGEEVAIDADVATSEVTEYPWRGLVLVDTPGVQSNSGATDHDRIAREATANADLVLFVVTNELFNQRLADHIRYILDEEGLGLAAKTCVVVNKVDRENNEDATLISSVGQVLEPHNEVPVYLCAARKLLQSREVADDSIAGRFEAQSRMAELVEGLNGFIADAGSQGRLRTPLSVTADILDSLESELVDTGDERNRLELIRRKRRALEQLQQQLRELCKSRKQEVRAAVMAQANEAAEAVPGITSQEELESLFMERLQQATSDLEAVHNAAEVDLHEAINEAREEIDSIGESPLALEVERVHSEQAVLDRVEPTSEGGTRAARLARQGVDPLQKGLEKLAQDPRKLRDMVYTVGKALGKNFRPWEAVRAGEKLAGVMSRAGKAMPLVAAALDFYCQYQDEKAEAEQEKQLAQARQALNKAFYEQAENEAQSLEAAVGQITDGPVHEALARLEAEAETITAADSQREVLRQEVCALRERCSALRSQIYLRSEISIR